MVSLTFPFSEAGGGHDNKSKDLNWVSKALHAGVPTVSTYLTENREIQSFQSETLFLHFPLAKVFIVLLFSTEAVAFSVTAA